MKTIFAYAYAVVVFLLDMLVPRMMTERTALVIAETAADGEHFYDVLCAFDDLDYMESYDATCVMHFFNFFGFALLPKIIGEIDEKGGVCNDR